MRLLADILILFLIMDPIGNMPVFATHLKNVDEKRRTWIVARESVIALLVLLFFLFFGPLLTELLHIGPPSLYLSGGVLLFLISLGMIFPGAVLLAAVGDEQVDEEPFIVPLAVPLVAGPSTVATIMIFSSQQQPVWLWVVALVAAWVVSSAILLLSSSFSRLLGPRGLRACERLMGMVLIIISVQMSLDGIRLFLRGP
jgi:multiple antibiotic resistance protein